MKLLILFWVLLGTVYADVINLGTLDSREQMLDQRFVETPTEQDRQSSLRAYYSGRELDFYKEVQSEDEVKIVKPDEEWKKLLEGLL